MKKLFVMVAIAAIGFSTFSCGNKGEPLKVMSYNINYGVGIDGIRDLERIAAVINDHAPDYVALQEVDNMTTRSGWTDQTAELARLTNMHAIYAPSHDYEGGTYGIGALVRDRPLRWTTMPIEENDGLRQMLILEYSGYVLINGHIPAGNLPRMAAMATASRIAMEYDKPVILTADFGTELTGGQVEEMPKWELLSKPAMKTYTADKPAQTFDYIFGYKVEGKNWKPRKFEVIAEPVASDHRPVYVEI